MAKTTGPTQADILLNENSILAARSRRILQSLLRPAANGAQAETEDQLELEDADIFKPEPDELLGPGYPIAENGGHLPGTQNSKSLRADEQLRRHMLGKNAKRSISGVPSSSRTINAAKANVNSPAKPRPVTMNQSVESDDEEGRSSLGKTKRRKTVQSQVVGMEESGPEEGEQATTLELAAHLQTPIAAKMKKPGSFLDEILSERSKKKKKKKRSGEH